MIEPLKILLNIVLILLATAASADERTIRADVWADNWFALYLETTLIKEDSVAYNTEKSFNADSFEFTAKLPAQINVILKDFKENDSGLDDCGI